MTRSKLHRKIFERIQESNGDHVSICESIKRKLQLSKLVRFFFPAESTNAKNENNSSQSYRRWMHSLDEYLLSQSLFFQALNIKCSQWMIYVLSLIENISF